MVAWFEAMKHLTKYTVRRTRRCAIHLCLCEKYKVNIKSKVQKVGYFNMRVKQRTWCASVPLVSSG